MNRHFFKFPHTPHLTWLGTAEPRVDKVLSPEARDAFFDGEIVVEEKIDGANVGISVGLDGQVRVQNRGTYVGPGAHPQFGPLWEWVAKRTDALVETLGTALVLFGEWCFAVHSVRYDRLPDWLLGFDIYDRAARCFWSTERRDEVLRQLSAHSVPEIARGRLAGDELLHMLDQRSTVGSSLREGLYLRREESGRLEARAKLVRAEFVQAISAHWTKRELEKNILAPCETDANDARPR